MSAVYRVVVWAVANNSDGGSLIGETEVVANNKSDARFKAHAELWNESLERFDCHPAYNIWKRLD